MAVLEGPHRAFGSVMIFPGVQFIPAQLVARPTFCYSIPAIRMGMDLLVYVLMICLFAEEVLWYEGTIGAGETVFFLYVLGAALIEVNELWDGREEYRKDHRNTLDVMALAFCGTAFLIRCAAPTIQHPGFRAVHAGAGPMIEIIFSLTGELLRFFTILLVTMVGFGMSSHVLFRHSCTVEALRTYWSTAISLLRAMLGETKLFDDFPVPVECYEGAGLEPSDELHCEDFLMECCHIVESEHFNGLDGKALLAAYDVVMGIILLNLLLAVSL